MKTTKNVWSKMLLAGMLSMVLTFGLVLVGCASTGTKGAQIFNSISGKKIPGDDETVLVFQRPDRSTYNGTRISIYIDKVYQGRIGPLEELEIVVPRGNHAVHVQNDFYETYFPNREYYPTIEVDCNSDSITFSTTFSKWNGVVSLSRKD